MVCRCPQPSHHHSASVRLVGARMGRAVTGIPLRRSSHRGARVRRRLSPQGHGEPHRRPCGRRATEPELQGLSGTVPLREFAREALERAMETKGALGWIPATPFEYSTLRIDGDQAAWRRRRRRSIEAPMALMSALVGSGTAVAFTAKRGEAPANNSKSAPINPPVVMPHPGSPVTVGAKVASQAPKSLALTDTQ